MLFSVFMVCYSYAPKQAASHRTEVAAEAHERAGAGAQGIKSMPHVRPSSGLTWAPNPCPRVAGATLIPSGLVAPHLPWQAGGPHITVAHICHQLADVGLFVTTAIIPTTKPTLRLQSSRPLGTLPFPPIPPAALHHLHLLPAAVFPKHPDIPRCILEYLRAHSCSLRLLHLRLRGHAQSRTSTDLRAKAGHRRNCYSGLEDRVSQIRKDPHLPKDGRYGPQRHGEFIFLAAPLLRPQRPR